MPLSTIAPSRYEIRLIEIVKSAPDLMAILALLRDMSLGTWAIGAGAIRNLVWDEMHGFTVRTPLQDVDVVFYDDDLSGEAETHLLQVSHEYLQTHFPLLTWDLVNQASVHHWLRNSSDQEVVPFKSLEEGIASWPETATCVGVYLDAKSQIKVIAPYGLHDLFDLKVRHNATRVGYETYLSRIREKNFRAKWPLLEVIL